MTRRLRITADPFAVSMARAIRAAAGVAPLLCLTGRALGDLAVELGGMDAALRHPADVAGSIGRPVGVNMPTGPDTSSTAFLALRGRTDGRLAGYHEELEHAFGEVARMGGPDVREPS
jgi:hypothetical protein